MKHDRLINWLIIGVIVRKDSAEFGMNVNLCDPLLEIRIFGRYDKLIFLFILESLGILCTSGGSPHVDKTSLSIIFGPNECLTSVSDL